MHYNSDLKSDSYNNAVTSRLWLRFDLTRQVMLRNFMMLCLTVVVVVSTTPARQPWRFRDSSAARRQRHLAGITSPARAFDVPVTHLEE
jgi:hypothetical protein